jgi:osmoprotectant transport system ATP-binding protein
VSTAPLVEFDDVSLAYGERAAVRNIRLQIEKGETLAIVGRSGSGKTTLLKLVNRLLLPSSGRVMVEGQDTRSADPIRLRRRIGYAFQDVGLFPHMTVEENISIVPRLEEWPLERTRARTHELLELMGLSPAAYAARFQHELSGGQRQRVGLARAFAVDPPILLMDEPFGALDPLTRLEVRREFARVQRQLGTTVMIVTHDLGEAFALGQRVGVLDEGSLVTCDTPASIMKSSDRRVRAFVETITEAPVPAAPHP